MEDIFKHKHIGIPVLQYIKFIYIYDLSSGEDPFYWAKYCLCRALCLIVPILCLINLVYVYRERPNVLAEDLTESVAMLLSTCTLSLPGFYLGIYPGMLDMGFSLSSDFKQFGMPKEVPQVVRLIRICSKYILIAILCVCIIYVSYGITTEAECERLNVEYDLYRTCGVPTPILFVRLTGWIRYVPFVLLFVGLLFPALTGVGALLLFFLAYEIIILRIRHLKIKLLELKGNNAFKTGFKRRFHYCSVYHSDILQSIIILNSESGPAAVVYVLISSIIISILCYQAMHTSKLLGVAAHGLCWIFGMFTLCICGQRLTNENISLEYEFYDILWYPKEFIPLRTDLALMIMRGQRNIGIAAKPMGLLNLFLFSEIMRGAYSYLTMMSSMS